MINSANQITLSLGTSTSIATSPSGINFPSLSGTMMFSNSGSYPIELFATLLGGPGSGFARLNPGSNVVLPLPTGTSSLWANSSGTSMLEYAPVISSSATAQEAGLTPDLVSIFGVSTTAGSTTVSTGTITANNAESFVGKTIHVPMAGESGADLFATVISAYNNTVIVSVAASETVTGKTGSIGTDHTALLQSLIDAKSASGGGVVVVEPGIYLINGLVLRSGVILRGASSVYLSPTTGQNQGTILMGNGSSPWVVSCDSVMVYGGIDQCSIQGVGAGASQGGLQTDGSFNTFSNLLINMFGEQGMSASSDCLQNNYQNIIATNCYRNHLSVATSTQLMGVLEFNGTDHLVSGCFGYGGQENLNADFIGSITGDTLTITQMNAGMIGPGSVLYGPADGTTVTAFGSGENGGNGFIPGVTTGIGTYAIDPSQTMASKDCASSGGGTVVSPSLNQVGILCKGSNIWFDRCGAEQADVGIYDANQTGPANRWTNCRAMLNYGHGIFMGTGRWVDCYSLANSAALTGCFSGYINNGNSGGSAVNCLADTGSSATQHKYGFEDHSGGAIPQYQQFKHTSPRSIGHSVAKFLPGQYNTATLIDRNGIQRTDLGTTPNVEDTTTWVCSDSSTVVVTNFLNGYDGQILWLLPNGNQTIENNANITTKTGANITPANGTRIKFENVLGVWVQMA